MAKPDDFTGVAQAHLFGNGNALFFDEQGEQVIQLQRLGLSGLHEFLKRYPQARVYWSIWKGEAQEVTASLPWLLRHIKRRPRKRLEG